MTNEGAQELVKVAAALVVFISLMLGHHFYSQQKYGLAEFKRAQVQSSEAKP